MTSLIKNQILKHLSKFAKNLSHDQINLSALKGEGELKNLELDEKILTDLLELPSWLRLSRATCNRVAVRIQWTKLKSVPIQLSLDEVHVEVETCEELRTSACGAGNRLPAYASGGHYGFSDKVVDGITLTVNSVILTLKSRVFTASFQMSRIVVESKSPTWQKADLRMTRVKDPEKGEVLIFKELSWQTVRIEARSTVNNDLTPLRLITNQARCRITIKKKMADCSVLGCRLVLILDDLLWVLTDDQLKAALHFADSLTGLLKRATEETQKIKGARKLESLSDTHTKEQANKRKNAQPSMAAKVFAKYDVIETSYHFYSDRIDLHLCDDPGGKGRSSHPQLGDGGAFQISLSQLQVDFYPYHLAASDRRAWIRYQDGVHSTWLEQNISQFQTTLLDTLTSATAKFHTPLARAAPVPSQSPTPISNSLGGGASDPKATQSETAIRTVILSQFKKLMTNNLIVRLSNFCMWRVSTSQGKVAPKEFLAGDRERFSLPDDMPVLHFEYTQFYYPGDLDFPLPPPKLFAYINPLQLTLDPLTVLWLNAFALNLQQSVKKLSPEQTDPPYLDVKLEAIMFRLIYESPDDSPKQRDRPKSLHIQISRVLAANYRSLETGSKADLARCLDKFQESQLFFGTDFPNRQSDIPTVCAKLIQHATGEDNRMQIGDHFQLNDLSRQNLWQVMKKDLLWIDAKDVWFVHLDPIWADFHGTPAVPAARPIPLVDAFPLTLWMYKPLEDDASHNNPNEAKMHVIGQISSLVTIQLNHFQLLFLLRMLEALTEITTFLTQDVRHILGEEDESSMALGIIAPQIDLSLLMPSVSQSRDYIGGDYTDTEALADTTSMYSMGTVEDPPLPATPSPSTTPKSSFLMADPFANQVVSSAPASPVHSSGQLTMVESAPDLTGMEPKGTPSKAKAPPPNSIKPLPPPAIHLPTSVSSPNGKPSKKSQLASSLSNMMAHLDSSYKSPEDDTLSIGSSDSESYVVINQVDSDSGRDSMDALFTIHSKRASPVEVGLEVTEDSTSEKSVSMGSDRPMGSERGSAGRSSRTEDRQQREGVVSVLTFHLGRLELAQQSKGTHSCLKLQAASLSANECPAISWEEFQGKFSLHTKGWCESTLQPQSSWCLKLRLSTSAPQNIPELLRSLAESGTSISLREKISRSAEAYLELRVQNLPLQLNMSTLQGLTDLVEDELIPQPMPMNIRLDNLAIHLIEDRPSANITSPGSLPIDIAIPALAIIRDKSGMFSIQPADLTTILPPDSPILKSAGKTMSHHLDLVRSGVASIETELQQRASLLTMDNANLRIQLDNLQQELQMVRGRLTEAENQCKKYAKSHQAVQAMDKENKALKETLKYLQQELVKSGKKNVKN